MVEAWEKDSGKPGTWKLSVWKIPAIVPKKSNARTQIVRNDQWNEKLTTEQNLS